MGHQCARVFNHFGIAIFQAQGLIQQFNDARVHARQNGQAAIGEFIAEKLYVFAGIDEVFVVIQNFC